MRALAYTRPLEIGELSKELQMLDLPVPEPEEGQLLVRVRASCINIDDLHFAEGTFMGGLYPSRASGDKPSIPGVDVAGTVEKLGPEVSGFTLGDEVFGIARSKPGTRS